MTKQSFSFLTAAVLPLSLLFSASPVRASQLTGEALTGHEALGSARITLYQAASSGAPAIVLGTTQSKSNGAFRIAYESPAEQSAVLYVIAKVSPEIKLAAVLGAAPRAQHVVVNERTTVATAFAMAQFIEGETISGNGIGLPNAASMLRNLVSVSNGSISPVLQNSPNGNETSAWRDFDTLANMIARCVENTSDCSTLFALSESPKDGVPTNTLQAMENIARNPAHNVVALLAYARGFPLYQPALRAEDRRPDAWTLALRFTDRNSVLDGPGLIAFDRFGNAWVNNNYLDTPNPTRVCGDNHLLAFGPDGHELPGSPYGGGHHDGGLYGSGFGIAIDPYGDVWVSNFGFFGSECAIKGTPELSELSRSVSQFDHSGQAISPSTPPNPPPYGGWRGPEARIDQPQGTVSDPSGNIWVGNCGNDSVTKVTTNPIRFTNYTPIDDNGAHILSKPFGLAVDPDNRIWVASNNNHSIVELEPDESAPPGACEFLNQDGTCKVITDPSIAFPMGIASDPAGNIWVANSAAVHPPCGGDTDANRISDEVQASESRIKDASVSVYLKDTDELVTPPFTGGGIYLPWGIAVDGNNDIWVANFAGPRSGLIGVAELCGVGSPSCAPDQFGQPLSPDTGYTSDGLVRVTGVSIDSSGNVWLANNWLRELRGGGLQNPGGHQLVVFLGLAAPIKTPLIGPPESP